MTKERITGELPELRETSPMIDLIQRMLLKNRTIVSSDIPLCLDMF